MQTSRREFFKYMAVLGLGTLCTTPLYAKTPKEIVKYQSTPNNGQKCMECMHFIPETNECRTVEGSIDPNGWCTIYFRDPKYKEIMQTDSTTE
ncbi:MAG TPA: hypothetical protein VLL31_07030 [Sulfurovum sp.]|nr:hypothetical protein [Sulfurovum sp.]